MILAVVLTGCANTANNLVEKPARPRISKVYQKLLEQAGPETEREAQAHEWKWHEYGDKMEDRAGY